MKTLLTMVLALATIVASVNAAGPSSFPSILITTNPITAGSIPTNQAVIISNGKTSTWTATSLILDGHSVLTNSTGSGGSTNTPTLQAVTLAGAATTNQITVPSLSLSNNATLSVDSDNANFYVTTANGDTSRLIFAAGDGNHFRISTSLATGADFQTWTGSGWANQLNVSAGSLSTANPISFGGGTLTGPVAFGGYPSTGNSFLNYTDGSGVGLQGSQLIAFANAGGPFGFVLQDGLGNYYLTTQYGATFAQLLAASNSLAALTISTSNTLAVSSLAALNMTNSLLVTKMNGLTNGFVGATITNSLATGSALNATNSALVSLVLATSNTLANASVTINTNNLADKTLVANTSNTLAIATATAQGTANTALGLATTAIQSTNNLVDKPLLTGTSNTLATATAMAQNNANTASNLAAVANGLASTAIQPGSTNGFADKQFVFSNSDTNGAANSVSNSITLLGYVTKSVTNPLPDKTFVYSNTDTNGAAAAVSNSITALGYVTKSVTNPLPDKSFVYANADTNGAAAAVSNAVTSLGYITKSATNGLVGSLSNSLASFNLVNLGNGVWTLTNTVGYFHMAVTNPPLTTAAIFISGSGSGLGYNLGIGSSNTVLTSMGTLSAPAWNTPASGGGSTNTFANTNATVAFYLNGANVSLGTNTASGSSTSAFSTVISPVNVNAGSAYTNTTGRDGNANVSVSLMPGIGTTIVGVQLWVWTPGCTGNCTNQYNVIPSTILAGMVQAGQIIGGVNIGQAYCITNLGTGVGGAVTISNLIFQTYPAPLVGLTGPQGQAGSSTILTNGGTTGTNGTITASTITFPIGSSRKIMDTQLVSLVSSITVSIPQDGAAIRFSFDNAATNANQTDYGLAFNSDTNSVLYTMQSLRVQGGGAPQVASLQNTNMFYMINGTNFSSSVFEIDNYTSSIAGHQRNFILLNSGVRTPAIANLFADYAQCFYNSTAAITSVTFTASNPFNGNSGAFTNGTRLTGWEFY